MRPRNQYELEEALERLQESPVCLWGTREGGAVDSCLIHGDTRPHVHARDLKTKPVQRKMNGVWTSIYYCEGCGELIERKPPPRVTLD